MAGKLSLKIIGRMVLQKADLFQGIQYINRYNGRKTRTEH